MRFCSIVPALVDTNEVRSRTWYNRGRKERIVCNLFLIPSFSVNSPLDRQLNVPLENNGAQKTTNFIFYRYTS